MAEFSLIELDSLDLLTIIDNDLDPISKTYVEGLSAYGNLGDIVMDSPHRPQDRGGLSVHEVRMDQICQGAHGLSILLTGGKDGKERSILFDAGPEEEIFERNATRLRAVEKLGKVEVVHLSHWHRDHSGGMLRAIKMINQARAPGSNKPIIDLHPARPDFRGVTTPILQMSLEADPTFQEIEDAGAIVSKSTTAHTVLDGYFLVSGEIPRITSYEVGMRNGARFSKEKGEWEKDEKMEDERFVMCKVKGRISLANDIRPIKADTTADKGIVMFTGCSHAGVVNASRHAIKLGKGAPLYAVIGGYHLADAEPTMIEQSIRDLKALDPKVLLPGHCTGWRAKYKIGEEMPGRLAPCVVGTKYMF